MSVISSSHDLRPVTYTHVRRLQHKSNALTASRQATSLLNLALWFFDSVAPALTVSCLPVRFAYDVAFGLHTVLPRSYIQTALLNST
jgi:hypothetical protein